LPLPKSIQDAPFLHFGLQIYFDAFFELSSCRINSFEIGRLNWLMIDEYCKRQGLDEEQSEDMHYFIRKMDDAYVEYQKDKQSKGKKK
jgi:hypothetical protein